jgi:hypothetical protein
MSLIDRTFTFKRQIKVSSNDLHLARKGIKVCTIRLGKVSVASTDMILSDGRESMLIKVTEVDSGRVYSELTDTDARLEGFSSLEELHSDLSRYYPRIDPRQPMTIIKFVAR